LSRCCENCFNSPQLIKIIRDSGEKGECNFCGASGVKCVTPSTLAESFRPLVELYIEIHYLDGPSTANDGKFLWDRMNCDWNVFAFGDQSKQQRLLRDIFVKKPPQVPFDKYVDLEDPDVLDSTSCPEIMGWYDSPSVSEMKQWEDFIKEIRTRNRYFPSKKIHLKTLAQLLPSQEYRLPRNTDLFRARICENRTKAYPRKDMGKPPVHISATQSGRANPIGIPYLYVASDTSTAIAEVRPNVGDLVTVGTFLTNDELIVLDLRSPRITDPFRWGNKLGFITQYIVFLRRLGAELSKTISRTQAEVDYIPLQYLCEFIRKRKYQGVMYGSSVAKTGYNIAIFDDSKLVCSRTELSVVSGLNYTTIPREERIECSNPHKGVRAFRVHYADGKTGVRCNCECDICEYSDELQLWDKRKSSRA